MAARVIELALALLSMAGHAASLPDPTAPPSFRAGPESDVPRVESSLAWVKVNDNQSIAWYGGTAVTVGDTVPGGRVTAIREDHIVITGKDGKRAVYLLDHAVRTRPQVQDRPARKIRK